LALQTAGRLAALFFRSKAGKLKRDVEMNYVWLSPGARVTPSAMAMIAAAPVNTMAAPTGSLAKYPSAAIRIALAAIDSVHHASQSVVSMGSTLRGRRERGC
jgi:hypothetical protein